VSVKLPVAKHKGFLRIVEDAPIRCFVLDDETRVVSGRALTQAIGMKGRAEGALRIINHRALAPFVNDELRFQIEHPILFTGFSPKADQMGSGYEATVLVNVCDAILKADDAGALKTEQEKRYARYCSMLTRAFAKVGIIALVDEVTGYQAERVKKDKTALQRILALYIAPELLPWAQRFPPEFYEELFRLREWQYQPISVKRPRIVGKLTCQLVYEKLPPGVLEELRQKNPAGEDGRRKHRHHQFLTDDFGVPHLKYHLIQVIALMRASPNWKTFERLFARAFPAPVHQADMFEDQDSNIIDI
jgi:hypothetical protein